MADDPPNRTYEAPFRPRARMLRLLGDELIGSPRLAVFELVKNAYDADANEVTVRVAVSSKHEPTITVSDDGEGMSLDTIKSVWLVPGHDHRRRQRREGRRSPRHNRLPLGEKGVGRFAVHKLGDRITLITRAEDSAECVVDIDWNELTGRRFLDEALVKVSTRSPEVFADGRTGTQIEIRQLRPPEWTRGEVRRLCNQITSICSPFEEPGSFRAALLVPGHENWIEDLPDFAEILNRAIWRFRFSLRDGRFDCKYTFRRVAGFNIEGREVSKSGDVLKLPRAGRRSTASQAVANNEMTRGIGPITGEFFVFDRGREVLKQIGDTRLITQYLDEHGGVRVYRDGIRIYNYGERGDDWLGLDLRRVNIPTRRISRNIILGAVHLSLESSLDLIEKTNREGFVENETFLRLSDIVLGLVEALEEERQIDKERLRKLAGKSADSVFSGIDKPVQDLREALDDRGIREQFEPYVAKIERDYVGMQETLLTAGMSGLNLAVVFHEVERGVRVLHDVIVHGRDIEGAAEQARQLMHVLGGFSTVLRRDPKRRHRIRKLLDAAQQFSVLRLRHHRVRVTCPPLNRIDDFESRFSFGLVLGALNNLLDNALYWLTVRWPGRPPDIESSERRLFLGASCDLTEGPAIVVADNGPGFQDTPEHITRPFFTRKPDGMGLGLYYANLAMELNGGRLAFPTRQEVDVPEWCDGALVAMVFKGSE
ncbi:MAG: ATP-binding protein [Gemmatimonadetes bacterium]|nr:ATP-binding protein [Gemmatimonadota bacterium]MYH53563.1 ATP-binding protein [Gemmatimonadota bacterium]MYK65046.1 ATP-binding protein [Gemmatimonadota bacterium]